MEGYLLISDAAKEVKVESHVLRYWEEELHLPIKRNELGHRYYTKEDVERFKQIKSMKERGLQLKAIKMILKDGKLDLLPMEDDGLNTRGSGPDVQASSRERRENPRDVQDGGQASSRERRENVREVQDGGRDSSRERRENPREVQDGGQASSREYGRDGQEYIQDDRERVQGAQENRQSAQSNGRTGGAGGRGKTERDGFDGGAEPARADKGLFAETENGDAPWEGFRGMAIDIVEQRRTEIAQESRESKARRLQWLLQQLIRETLQENNRELCREIKESVVKELDYQFRAQEEREEERDRQQLQRSEEYYKRMDELLRKKSRLRRDPEERKRAAREKAERERAEKERLESERLERKRLEKGRKEKGQIEIRPADNGKMDTEGTTAENAGLNGIESSSAYRNGTEEKGKQRREENGAAKDSVKFEAVNQDSEASGVSDVESALNTLAEKNKKKKKRHSIF